MISIVSMLGQLVVCTRIVCCAGGGLYSPFKQGVLCPRILWCGSCALLGALDCAVWGESMQEQHLHCGGYVVAAGHMGVGQACLQLIL